MRSRTSFFDMRFCKHLLRRFWPLFLLWLALLLLAGPVGLNVNAHQEPARVITDLRSDLLSSGRGAVWLSALMGALMAMGMLSYLYNPRDCGLINSLPLRREGDTEAFRDASVHVPLDIRDSGFSDNT